MTTRPISASRGYAFEKYIVEQFNKKEGWQARRLGGTSTGLPDIVTTNKNTILAIEAKSTASKFTFVPNDEIKRCADILDMFSIYKNKDIMLAFKFKALKGVRKLRYYFYIVKDIKNIDNIKSISCNYDGKLKLNPYEKDKECLFTHYPMPELV